ncbi:MAG: glycosyltransferase [Prevotella sp.]|nr:glycosyltransferase [Prevotella sp.]
MTNPRITIVTTSFNSEATVEETILSVISQDYDNLEYVIIDGMSTDNTLDIVHKYHDKIDVILSEKDRGISDAFNKGIDKATGDIICFINSDDHLLPGVLKKVAKEYDGKADVYCGNVLLWNPENGFKCREVPSVKFPTTPFFCHVAHQGMFATKECYERFGAYDVNLRFPMDLDFLIRVSKGGGIFHYMDIDIAEFRSGGNTGSFSITEKKKDYLYMVRKNGGTSLQAYLFYYYLFGTQLVKKILSIFGMNFVQRLRYREISNS